jgi:hypothetical protein
LGLFGAKTATLNTSSFGGGSGWRAPEAATEMEGLVLLLQTTILQSNLPTCHINWSAGQYLFLPARFFSIICRSQAVTAEN